MSALDFAPAIRRGYAAKLAAQGWSHERDRAVAAHYTDGKTHEQIADEVGTSVVMVRQILARLFLHRAIAPRQGRPDV